MAKLKNISLITVLTISTKTPTMDVVEHGNLQHTSTNPLLPNMPVIDAAMATLVSALQTTYTGFKSVPPTMTEAQVNLKKNIVIASYNQNAGYIQGVARAVAVANGDINAGIELVLGSGYKIKKTKSPTARLFKVTNAGSGAVNILTKAVAARAGYIRQYGITPTKGVPPTVLEEMLFTLEINAYVNNLKSANIYGFREASVLPVKRTPKSGTPTTNVEKTATPTTVTKAHKNVFTDGATSHYVWSEWVYIVIL